MKVRPSVKPICEKCKVIKRKGKVRLMLFKIPKALLIITISYYTIIFNKMLEEFIILAFACA